MTQRYVAAACRGGETPTDWYVREVHPAGGTAQIKCYCWGMATAYEIAKALNLADAIDRQLTRGST